MVQISIKIDTHQKLIELKKREEIRTKKRVSFDDIIKEMLKVYESRIILKDGV